MIRGRFGVAGRPYVNGLLTLPRLSIVSEIRFLVDTGADTSLVAPSDAFGSGVDYSLRTGYAHSFGAAGLAFSFTEQAVIAFTDSERVLHTYLVDLAIAEPNVDFIQMPSILGREILDRWRMVYDPAEGELTFDVRSADVTLPI